MPSQDKNPKKQGNTDIDWINLLFPTSDDIASPRIKHVKNGPYGNARMANSSEIQDMMLDANRDPNNYIRLLDSYAVAHDIGSPPKALHLGGLPLQCGLNSPNILAIGPSGVGKTQKVIFPALRHCILAGNPVIYINVKGKLQTSTIELIAREASRENELKVIRPMARKGGLTFSGLNGCEEPSKAAKVATLLARQGIADWSWSSNQAKEWITAAISAICNDLPPRRRNFLELRKIILAGQYKQFANAHPRWVGLERFANYLIENQNGATVAGSIAEATAFVDAIPHFLGGSNDVTPDEIICSNAGIIILEVEEADLSILAIIINLFVSLFIESLQRNGSKNKTKWVIYLDELSVLSAEPAFVNSLHTCREKNFNFIAGVQSINQLSVYGPKAATILSGFQTKIVFPSSDYETSDYFSKASGSTSIKFKGAVLARPLLQASDISTPSRNRFLGSPATVFSGCGLRPIQVYIGNLYDDGKFAKLLDEEVAQETNDKIVEVPQSKPGGLVHGGHDEACVLTLKESIEYASLKDLIGWNSAKPSTRKWVSDLENTNIDKPRVLFNLVKEIATAGASINDFLNAFIHANSTEINVILAYMHFALIKAKAKLDSKKGKTKKAEEEEEDDIF